MKDQEQYRIEIIGQTVTSRFFVVRNGEYGRLLSDLLENQLYYLIEELVDCDSIASALHLCTETSSQYIDLRQRLQEWLDEGNIEEYCNFLRNHVEELDISVYHFNDFSACPIAHTEDIDKSAQKKKGTAWEPSPAIFQHSESLLVNCGLNLPEDEVYRPDILAPQISDLSKTLNEMGAISVICLASSNYDHLTTREIDVKYVYSRPDWVWQKRIYRFWDKEWSAWVRNGSISAISELIDDDITVCKVGDDWTYVVAERNPPMRTRRKNY